MALEEEQVGALKGLVEKKEWVNLKSALDTMHPHDISEFLQSLEENTQYAILQRLTPRLQAEVIPELPDESQLEFVVLMPPRSAANLLRRLPADERVDVLMDMQVDHRRRILRFFPREEADETRKLLRHPEDTAGGLMTTEVISFTMEVTVAAATAYVQRKGREFVTIYYIYVTDDNHRLTGVLSLRDLVIASPDDCLGDIMNPDVIKVPATMDQEEVARITADYNLTVVPVVDEDDSFVGIVTVDDIIDVIEEEAVEDLAHLAGTSGEIDRLIDAPTLTVVKHRLPWLVFALGGGIIASAVLKAFQTGITPSMAVSLAIFIPVIMAMGGNAGVQSSTVFVRGIATGEIENLWGYILREVRVGAIMGFLVGIIMTGTAQILVDKPGIGIVVGVAMFFSMTMACIIGVMIPRVLHYMGADPAISSSPFITTIQDIVGLFIYFGLASILLYRFI